MITSNARRTDPKRILICEDEAIVAMDLSLIVEDLGHEVVGPFATVTESLAACSQTEVDAAILDVQLRDGEVFPVAELLSSRGVALIFQSGHAVADELSETFPSARFCPKPVQVSRLLKYLEKIV